MIVRHLVTAAVLMLAPVLAPVLAPTPAASQGPPGDADSSGAETVTMQLSNFQFDPATITLRQGKAYDLRLENHSSGGHDFAAKEFFAAAQVVAADRGKIAGGKVSLAGGESIDIHLTAPATGTYKVRCTHFMHSTFGMTGEIVVQ